MSSLPFIGKFIGCLAAGPAIEKFGHRVVFFALSIVSFIGIISKLLTFHRLGPKLTVVISVEITAAGTAVGSGRYAQFIVGRIIVYMSVGLVEVDVT